MFKNRFLLALGVISLLLVTMAVSRPYSNAAKSVNLSKPARPMIIPLSRISNLPDYFQRHPELKAFASNTKSVDLSQPARPRIIPLSRISNLPDYFQRHPELRVAAGTGSSEAEDYFMRH